ncbi:PREDICTED: uncharacterized protein LOC106146981 isoform X2 [Chinchilla lanigera]|uniref:uncharacterized protein LOC106146981 isoform X2 n=1 Tax=Chinchilla lanigera TaxID=34839 RepID=UPI00069651D9|nr:PREDICTED: uncharacterized protein LOC106146981 isoform X2 [Chinchilla lanigera]
MFLQRPADSECGGPGSSGFGAQHAARSPGALGSVLIPGAEEAVTSWSPGLLEGESPSRCRKLWTCRGGKASGGWREGKEQPGSASRGWWLPSSWDGREARRKCWPTTPAEGRGLQAHAPQQGLTPSAALGSPQTEQGLPPALCLPLPPHGPRETFARTSMHGEIQCLMPEVPSCHAPGWRTGVASFVLSPEKTQGGASTILGLCQVGLENRAPQRGGGRRRHCLPGGRAQPDPHGLDVQTPGVLCANVLSSPERTRVRVLLQGPACLGSSTRFPVGGLLGPCAPATPHPRAPGSSLGHPGFSLSGLLGPLGTLMHRLRAPE